MSKPLYQQLNEQRTQGEWQLSGDKHDIQTADEAKLGLFALYAYEKAETNAQYTALAVNNLHHLAEALEGLAILAETYLDGSEKRKEYQTDNETTIIGLLRDKIESAKQALSRIS